MEEEVDPCSVRIVFLFWSLRKKVSQDLFVKPKLPCFTRPPTKSNESSSASQGAPCIQRLSPMMIDLPSYVDGDHRKQLEEASFSLFFLFCIIRFFFPSPKTTHTELKNRFFFFFLLKTSALRYTWGMDFRGKFSLIIKLNLSTY